MKWTVLLVTVIATTTQAQTVYKSVDAEGNIVYSDQPAPHGELVETLELDESDQEDMTDAAAESAARIEQMAEVTDRLKKDRTEREQQRQAEEALARQQTPPLIYREEYYHTHYPWYDRRYARPNHRHHRKPVPPHLRNRDLNNKHLLVPRSKLLTPKEFDQKRSRRYNSERGGYKDSNGYRNDNGHKKR